MAQKKKARKATRPRRFEALLVVRVSDAMKAQVEALAEKERRTVGELLRVIVEDGVAARSK
jgi:predicted transcriptional regulator